MENEIFHKINCKLLEIMNLIEHEKGFPLLSRDLADYIEDNPQKVKLCNIYLEVSKLRNYDE